MFEKLIENLKQEPVKEITYLDLTESRLMNPNLLAEKLKDISLLEDNQLLELLVVDYPTILYEVFEM